MKRRHGIPSILAVASLWAGTTAAQAPDSVTFHRSQWGAEFNISGGFFSAGALRFTSATHAWLLDLGAGYSHNSFSGPAGSGSGNLTTITAELGSRSHHSIGHRLYRLTTIGALLNYGRQSTTGGSTNRTTGVGVFGDLGATWLVTPHMGIGARWRVTASYVHGSSTNAGVTSTGNQVTLFMGTVVLAGQLYF